MTRSRFLRFALLLTASLVAGACGGGGDATGPSSSPGVSVTGNLLGGASSSLASAMSGAGAAAGPIVVSLESNPAIQATVGTDGSFTLRGLPEGGFTLVFKQDGVTLGTLRFDAVKPNQEITITVMLSRGSIVLLEEKRNGIGHGDIEIEGRVEAVLKLDPNAESRFMIDGKTVVAKPGQTAIREGNKSRSVSDVRVGRRVHVKGSWLEPEAGAQPVLALEIKLQGDESDDPDDPDEPSTKACQAGQKAEVEGKITVKAGSSITVFQQGKGDYLCAIGSARIRKGNTSYTPDQLQVGWRVHVKGTQTGPAGSACGVTASEVMVQQN